MDWDTANTEAPPPTYTLPIYWHSLSSEGYGWDTSWTHISFHGTQIALRAMKEGVKKFEEFEAALSAGEYIFVVYCDHLHRSKSDKKLHRTGFMKRDVDGEGYISEWFAHDYDNDLKFGIDTLPLKGQRSGPIKLDKLVHIATVNLTQALVKSA